MSSCTTELRGKRGRWKAGSRAKARGSGGSSPGMRSNTRMPGLPRAVMFRDSFASWLIPFLSEHFSRIVFSWEYSFDRALVEREHPDVVIQ